MHQPRKHLVAVPAPRRRMRRRWMHQQRMHQPRKHLVAVPAPRRRIRRPPIRRRWMRQQRMRQSRKHLVAVPAPRRRMRRRWMHQQRMHQPRKHLVAVPAPRRRIRRRRIRRLRNPSLLSASDVLPRRQLSQRLNRLSLPRLELVLGCRRSYVQRSDQYSSGSSGIRVPCRCPCSAG